MYHYLKFYKIYKISIPTNRNFLMVKKIKINSKVKPVTQIYSIKVTYEK